MNSFLFLGTGASTGVPIIGCECPVCTSPSPLNQRLRPSGLIRMGDLSFLVDVGPDFRMQALRAKIKRLDGLLLTHTHFDHIAGIDELRVFYLAQKRALPCLLSQESFEELRVRYYYLMQSIQSTQSLSAQLDFQVLPEEWGEIEFAECRIRYFSYFQGGMKVTGYRMGDFAYVSDIRDYPETIFEDLKGVKVLVLSALRAKQARWTFTLEEAVHFAQKTGASSTWLIHMNHDVEHIAVNRSLPKEVQLAYDGLEISFGT